MFKIIFRLLLTTVITAALTGQALAQTEDTLTLRMSRDFGYSSGTGRIQGLFSMKASGPDNLARVRFYIDEEVIGEDNEAPFSLQFNTDNYALGAHTLYCLGITASGSELRSNEINVVFATAEESWQTAAKIAGPLLGIVFGALLIGFVMTMISVKKGSRLPLGARRSYGLKGGAICPKCQRPFGLHLFGFNLLVNVFDFCPHCGKWSLVRRASPEALRAAEEAELTTAGEGGQATELSAEEKLKRELDASRFQDV